jgi:hypothetical protein
LAGTYPLKLRENTKNMETQSLYEPSYELLEDAPSKISKTLPYDSNVEEWKTVMSLLANLWFSRTWTVQEAVLCEYTMVIYGDVTFPFDNLLDMAEMVPLVIEQFPALRKFSRGLGLGRQIRNLRQSSQKQSSFLALRIASRGLGATDPRDHIYGLLGLAFDADMLPEPDYHKLV